MKTVTSNESVSIETPAISVEVQSDQAPSTEISTEVEVAAEVIVAIELLNDNSKLPAVIAKLNEIINRINDIKSVSRNRGPSSTREMTDEDARRIMIGDLVNHSHTEAAKTLNLSYGQIYSARKGYTFKPIYKEAHTKK